jgi:hypothetical protein
VIPRVCELNNRKGGDLTPLFLFHRVRLWNFAVTKATYCRTNSSERKDRIHMKKIILGLMLLLGLTAFSQSNSANPVALFGQCMIEMNTAEEMRALETEMRANPYIKVVRLDYNTQRAFILTQNIDQLTEEQFTSWFNAYADQVRCIQIGRHGVDVVKPYPFEGCEKQ